MKVQMFFKKQLAFCLAMAMIVGPAAAADTVNAAGDPEMGIVQSEDILSSSSESRRTMADELEAHTYPAAAHSINLSWSAAENAARTAELSDQENGVLIDEDSHPLWRFTVESNGLYALEMTYSIPGDSGNNPSFSMLMDGESPYQEAENITVYRKWQDMGEITVNTLGDEVRPTLWKSRNGRQPSSGIRQGFTKPRCCSIWRPGNTACPWPECPERWWRRSCAWFHIQSLSHIANPMIVRPRPKPLHSRRRISLFGKTMPPFALKATEILPASQLPTEAGYLTQWGAIAGERPIKP